ATTYAYTLARAHTIKKEGGTRSMTKCPPPSSAFQLVVSGTRGPYARARTAEQARAVSACYAINSQPAFVDTSFGMAVRAGLDHALLLYPQVCCARRMPVLWLDATDSLVPRV
ncbi:MAG: hypothetical protein SGPRY_012496, partial [Prymnesium sp.]